MKKSFFSEMYFQIFGQYGDVDGYESFIRLYRDYLVDKKDSGSPKQVVILLDEAQLYPPNLIEKIRFLADTRLFKILFTVHKTDEEDTLAKDYFKTRIWSSIELPNSTLNELKLYIEKKLMFHNFHQYYYMYNDENFNIIYHLTDGNLRNLNKLLFKIYELCEYYEENKPTEIGATLNQKLIEMAAISAGLIDA